MPEIAALFAKRLRAGIVSEGAIRLYAFVGLEAAREVLPECGCPRPGPWDECDQQHALSSWAAGLPGLALSYPAREECGRCKGTRYRLGYSPRRLCNNCKGTGTVKREIGAQHLAVTACIGVARAVLEDWEVDRHHSVGCGRLLDGGKCTCYSAISAATRAAAHWRDDPEWEGAQWAVRVVANERLSRPDWAWQPARMAYAWDGAARSGLAVAFVDAATHIGERAVRDAVMEAVVPREWR